MNKREKGAAGESLVCAYLRRRGCEIVAQNYGRRGRGELDIIAKDGPVYAFVEVKQRDTLRYGTPAESVTRVKMRRIVETALLWLAERGENDAAVRFDVAEVWGERVHYIENAFDATGLFDS